MELSNELDSSTSISFKQVKQFVYILSIIFLLGRAWQHFFWDVPLRSFFWDEALLSTFVESFAGVSWSEYVTSLKVDEMILSFQRGLSLFFLLSVPVVFFVKSASVIRRAYYFTVLAYFSFLFFLYYKEKWFQIAMILEFALQWSLLLLCALFSLKKTISLKKTVLVLKIASAVTFVAHGIYAVGIFPRPGHFIDMTISILGCSEEVAIYFLNTVGILDFIVAAGLFTKFKGVCLGYMVFWGALTAFARLWANVSWEHFAPQISFWLPEFLLRTPHFLLPFLLLWILKSNNSFSHQERSF